MFAIDILTLCYIKVKPQDVVDIAGSYCCFAFALRRLLECIRCLDRKSRVNAKKPVGEMGKGRFRQNVSYTYPCKGASGHRKWRWL